LPSYLGPSSDVRPTMLLHETLPLALAGPTGPGGESPRVRLSARPRVVRLRRVLPSATSEREWMLEVEVEVPVIDPERLLTECEEFLVDGRDGLEIGVVDRVELSGPEGPASALLIATGLWGRRRFRLDAQAVEAILPGERRVIIDESRMEPIDDGRA
jgi:hypothetical protein